MSTVTLTTTPTILDAGTAYDLSLVNSGSLNIQVTVNGGSVGNLFSQILRPGQQVTVYPHGYPVSAFTASGTSSVDVTLGDNPQLNASREAAQDALAAGALVKTANLSDLANPGTARTNLGLGTAATHPDTDFLTPSAASATYASLSALTSPRLRRDTFYRGFPVASNAYASAGMAGTATLSATSGTSRSKHTALVEASDLRLIYGNYYVNGGGKQDQDGANTLTVKASIEINSVIYPLTFGGLKTVTIEPGGTIHSDPLGFTLPAGTVFYVRTYVSASAAPFGNMASYNSSTGQGFAAGSDLTATGAGAVSAGTAYMYGPFAVTGTPTVRTGPIVAVTGDSISVGVGDPAGDGNTAWNGGGAGGGYIQRALNAAGVPGVYLGVNGDYVEAVFQSDTKTYRRMPHVNGCTHAICEHGVNDIAAGSATQAAIQAAMIVVWTKLAARGMKVWQTTITPYGGITSPRETIRTTVNDWFRAGAPMSGGVAVAVGTGGALLAGATGHPLTGYFEIADLAETARNSGTWKTGYSDDLIHPNSTGATALAPGITTASLT